MKDDVENVSLELPCSEASTRASADWMSVALAASRARTLELEASQAQVRWESSQKDYVTLVLRQQVQGLTEQMASVTSTAWHDGAQASSRTWGRILAYLEVKVVWPHTMRAAFATWQATLQIARRERINTALKLRLARTRAQHCVAAAALVTTKEICQSTFAVVRCWSAWAQLCPKANGAGQSRCSRCVCGNSLDILGQAAVSIHDLDQPASELMQDSMVSMLPPPKDTIQLTQDSVTSPVLPPKQIQSELESLIDGQHRMEEWLVGLSEQQDRLQQIIGRKCPVDTSQASGFQPDSGSTGETLRTAAAAAAAPDVAALLPTLGEDVPALHPTASIESFADDISSVSSKRQLVGDKLHPTDSMQALADDISSATGKRQDSRPSFISFSTLRSLSQSLHIGDIAHTWDNIRRMQLRAHENRCAKQPDTVMARFVHSQAFSVMMAALICGNTLTIGIEADYTMKCVLANPQEDVPSIFSTLSTAFSITFAIELLVRVASLRLWFFLGDECGWNIFDACLVLSSGVQLLASGSNMNFFRMLRAFREIRALRALRIVMMCKELRRMTLSIMSCLAGLSWAFLLLLLITYVFSILFMQAAAGYMKEAQASDVNFLALKKSYGSLWLTMYSLIQAISGGDDWVNIAGSLESVSATYLLVFVFYVLFVTFGVMNVLTGAFLESASELMDRDIITHAEITRKKAFASNLQQLFRELDINEDGILTWEDFQTALRDEAVQAFFSAQELDVLDAHLFFRLMAGATDKVAEEDFILGCMRLKGEAKSMHIDQLRQEQEKLAHEISEHLEFLTHRVSDVQLAVSQIEVARRVESTHQESLDASPSMERQASPTSTSTWSQIQAGENKLLRNESLINWRQGQSDWHQEVVNQMTQYKVDYHAKSAKCWLSRRHSIFTADRAPETFAAKFVTSSLVHYTMGSLILANTVIMGIETDASIKAVLVGQDEEVSGFFSITNYVFMVIFTLECILKACALGLWYFVGDDAMWNIFDILLVVSSLGQFFLTGLNVNFLRVLRVFRVIRALRVLRVLRIFRELRRMGLAIVSCMASLAWAFLLLLLITYVFAILFVQAAAAHVKDADPQDAEVEKFEEFYGSMPKALYSLIQAISGGNDWAAIAEPLQYISVVYTLLFIMYELFVTFGVLNVLTGVFLESASEIMDRDLITQGEVSRRKIFVRDMQTIFKELDKDCSDQLSWEEFREALQNPSVSAFFASQELDGLEPHVLFQLIAGSTGSNQDVDMEDFILACTRLRGSAKSMHVQHLHTETQKFYDSAGAQLQTVSDDLVAIHKELARLSPGNS